MRHVLPEAGAARRLEDQLTNHGGTSCGKPGVSARARIGSNGLASAGHPQAGPAPRGGYLLGMARPKPLVVVALGGNALLRRGEPADSETQRRNVEIAAAALARMAGEYELVVTHGNGPQVGLL